MYAYFFFICMTYACFYVLFLKQMQVNFSKFLCYLFGFYVFYYDYLYILFVFICNCINILYSYIWFLSKYFLKRMNFRLNVYNFFVSFLYELCTFLRGYLFLLNVFCLSLCLIHMYFVIDFRNHVCFLV